ncbi:MAG: tetratricopeptide repeat protein [Candidatus Cloacimonetes bacterium]|nr:tetratricopeptide repeat protein [Candidatus Cloacimonadota bacterium]MCF7815136.1 tetratricopeptide repeat protein [Candidatus Cloacimonadota bacterium]MCF7869160.1 tetratricopeptide repeat protein [Candidatus Cloacimonadota bacterium]MCF7884604.1 tetratricopeptide repeat protein [Candidatus Cloacimonadota bacterium]
MNQTKKTLKENENSQIRELISQAYKIMHSNPKKCIELSNQALELSQKNQFNVGQGMAYMHIGLGFFHQSDYQNALKNYLKAEPFFVKENYWYGLRSIYNNIGLVYHQWDNLEKALEYYQKDLDLAANFNDPKLSSVILNNIGRIYLNLEEYNKAIKYFTESLELCEEFNLSYMKSVCYDNLGNTFLELNKDSEAREYYNNSIAVKKEIEDFAGLNHIFQNIALLNLQSEDYQEALTALDSALQYARKVDEQNQIVSIYIKYAEIYEKLDQKEKQKEYLEKCLPILESNNFQSQAMKAYNQIAKFYESTKEYKKALGYYKESAKIKDRLSDEKKTRIIEELITTMDVERTEQEKELLKKKNIELEQMNKQILDQKKKLEIAEKELKELNLNLEKKVIKEIEKRRMQEQILMQKSKLESLGRMSAGIAHEINQPIGLIKLAMQNMFNKFENNKITSQYLKEKSNFIEENITRINKIIEHIRLFSRDQQQESSQNVDVKEVLENAFSMIQIQFKNHNITIEKVVENKKVSILGNKYRLEQVLLNLLSNAKDALDEKFDELDDSKKIIVFVREKDKNIVISVKDNGCGMDKTSIEHVFDPFYTTKSEGKGTGLGLSICYGIIQEMNGTISIESNLGEGTIVEIIFPVFIIQNRKQKKDHL